jgi:hypothetical protein
VRGIVSAQLAMLVLVGCGVAGPPAASPSSTSGSPTAAVATATPPASPTATAEPSATPIDEPLATPPLAILRLPDGREHAARTGSYCYMESCSDAPYWPTAASMIRVDVPSADGTLAVTVPESMTFSAWRASYADRDDHFAEMVMKLADGGNPEGPPTLAEAEFSPPPSGEWLLEVKVWLPDGEGSVSYYWYVAVP